MKIINYLRKKIFPKEERSFLECLLKDTEFRPLYNKNGEEIGGIFRYKQSLEEYKSGNNYKPKNN